MPEHNNRPFSLEEVQTDLASGLESFDRYGALMVAEDVLREATSAASANMDARKIVQALYAQAATLRKITRNSIVAPRGWAYQVVLGRATDYVEVGRLDPGYLEAVVTDASPLSVADSFVATRLKSGSQGGIVAIAADNQTACELILGRQQVVPCPWDWPGEEAERVPLSHDRHHQKMTGELDMLRLSLNVEEAYETVAALLSAGNAEPAQVERFREEAGYALAALPTDIQAAPGWLFGILPAPDGTLGTGSWTPEGTMDGAIVRQPMPEGFAGASLHKREYRLFGLEDEVIMIEPIAIAVAPDGIQACLIDDVNAIEIWPNTDAPT
jgi:hypothetical protein